MSVTITGVFPSYFQPGQNILIQATAGGFGAGQPAGATVTFTEEGGSSEVLTSTTFVSWSDTQIVVTTPATFAGSNNNTYDLTVSGTGLSSANFFQVNPHTNSATITSITPSTTSAGTSITITGTGFPTPQGTHFLAWDSATNLGFTVTSWFGTSIVATLPADITGSFPPGKPHTIAIWAAALPPIVPAQVLSASYIDIQGPPTVTTIAPSQVAPGQTCTITGSGFGATQGTTVFQLNGSSVTPVSWSDTTIVFVIPAPTTAGTATITIGSVPYQSTALVNVVTALALPGGTSAVQGQPVHLTGAGFGATTGSLIYFGASGLTTTLAVTDWTDTSIYTNLPSSADEKAGFIYLFLTGATAVHNIFSGFTVTAGSSGPQTSKYIADVTWVTSYNTTSYPLPQYQQGNVTKYEPLPRGRVHSVSGSTAQVEWLSNVDTDSFTTLSAPLSDLIALGSVSTATLVALGLAPTPGGGPPPVPPPPP